MQHLKTRCGIINSQSLQDMQVGYISQKYTLDNYSLEKYTLTQKSLVMMGTSLVMVATSLVVANQQTPTESVT